MKKNLLFLITLICLSLTSCRDYSDEFAEINAELEQIKNENELQTALIKAISVTLKTLETKISSLEENQEELKNQLLVINSSIVLLQSNIDNMNENMLDEFLEILDEIEDLEDDIEDLEEINYDIEELLEDLVDSLNNGNNNTNQDSLNDQIEALLDQIEALQNARLFENVELTVNDLKQGTSAKMASISGNTKETVLIKGHTIFFDMDEDPWDTFESITLNLTNGQSTTLSDLDKESNWKKQNGMFFLEFNHNETIEAGTTFEYTFNVTVSNIAENDDIGIMVHLSFQNTSGGVSNTLETSKKFLELEE